MVYSPLVNDKISDASGGEKFWDLKWAETFKNEVFGAEGAENFWGPEIMVYPPLLMTTSQQGGGGFSFKIIVIYNLYEDVY